MFENALKLYARVLGKGTPVVILHGLFGSGDNLGTFAMALSEEGYQVHLLDLRNHGRSPHSDAVSYQLLAEDVAAYITENKLAKPALAGHSMGGKTAMFLASTYPELISRLVVIDISPRAYPPHHSNEIAGLLSVQPETLSNRQEANERMSEHIKDANVRAFLLKNLGRDTDGNFAWKMNTQVIIDNIGVVNTPLFANTVVQLPTLFVRGGESRYIKDEEWPQIQKQFPNATLVTIPGADHWVHAQEPEKLKQEIIRFLNK